MLIYTVYYLAAAKFDKPMLQSDIICSTGFIKLWPGAVLIAIRMSMLGFRRNRTHNGILTDSFVRRCSGPSSVKISKMFIISYVELCLMFCSSSTKVRKLSVGSNIPVMSLIVTCTCPL